MKTAIWVVVILAVLGLTAYLIYRKKTKTTETKTPSKTDSKGGSSSSSTASATASGRFKVTCDGGKAYVPGGGPAPWADSQCAGTK